MGAHGILVENPGGGNSWVCQHITARSPTLAPGVVAGLHPPPNPPTPSFLLLQTLLAQMVGEDRLCTFRQFGFEDKGTRSIASAISAPDLAKAQQWMAECGGINGQAKGITANRLDPADRVAAVLEQILQTTE